MSKKIVLLPLDERPCNSLFPKKLFSHEELKIVTPERLGNKKRPADMAEIEKFLKKECEGATGLVLSADMLLYGGLVPSRIHNEKEEVLKERLKIIKDIRKEYPELLIYAFQVIMRCPDYSSDDEEPDYYEDYGKEIHELGARMHKSHLGEDDVFPAYDLLEKVPEECLSDYISRRKINRNLNLEILKYVENNIIDFLVVPQDDSSTYGYAAMDQRDIRNKIAEYGLESRALMYPGADEVELTLMSRMVNALHENKPKVYIKYAAEAARFIIPLYEGNMLSGTLKYHILSAGCRVTESYENADIILAVTAPAGEMEEAINQPSKYPGYYAERNFAEMLDFIKDRLSEGKIVTIADNAYANGGDLRVIRLLNNSNMLMKISGYAGWNTSANTVGTAIAEAVDDFYYDDKKAHSNFLISRYIEDAGYCSVVRNEVSKSLDKHDMNYFDVKEEDGIISALVKNGLEAFVKTELSSVSRHTKIKSVRMPWKRMFEIDIDAGFNGD